MIDNKKFNFLTEVTHHPVLAQIMPYYLESHPIPHLVRGGGLNTYFI